MGSTSTESFIPLESWKSFNTSFNFFWTLDVFFALINSLFLNFWLILYIGAFTGPKIFASIDFDKIFLSFTASISSFFSFDEDKIKAINLS